MISAGVALWQWRLHRLPLKIEVVGEPYWQSLQPAKKEGRFLFRLSFINPSSLGRTVYKIEHKALGPYQFQRIRGRIDFEKDVLHFGNELHVQLSDCFSPSLDIRPHSSENRWVVYDVTENEPSSDIPVTTSVLKRALLSAYDANNKKLASTIIELDFSKPYFMQYDKEKGLSYDKELFDHIEEGGVES